MKPKLDCEGRRKVPWNYCDWQPLAQYRQLNQNAHHFALRDLRMMMAYFSRRE